MFQRYLAHTGWKAEAFPREDVSKFVSTEDQSIYVLVPKEMGVSDYKAALLRVANTIAQFESRDVQQVLANVICPNVDYLQFRFTGAITDLGSLPLNYMLDAVSNIRHALVYSACGELNPQPSYGRALKQAIEVTKKTRFGQTSPGSFIISVEVPHSPPAPIARTATARFAEDPLERRIVTRILRGVSKAKLVATRGETVDPQEEYRYGLNANLADSLAALRVDDFDLAVEVGAKWDASVTSATPLPDRPVLIERTTFDSLVSIGNAFRSDIATRDVLVTGMVVGLSRDDWDNGDETKSVIVLKASGREDIPRNIRVVLSTDDYQRACDVHKERKQIRLRGRLERPGGGKHWWLTAYRDFEVMDRGS